MELAALFAELRGGTVSVHTVSPEAAVRATGALAASRRAGPGAYSGNLGVDCLRPGDVTFLGSGFVYGSGDFVATCAHLFENRFTEPLFAVRFGEGGWRLAELWGASAAADVAVLRLIEGGEGSATAAGRRRLRLSSATPLPRQGEWVAVCGSTQHGCDTVGVVGVVTQPRQAFHGLAEEAGVHFVQVAVPTLPGMSGSPVVGASGEVVGMLAKKFEEHGLALPAAHVATVAHCLQDGGCWRPPVLGLELAIGGTVQQPRVAVRAVHVGCAAEAAGVCRGDEILTVEGTNVRSVVDVREALLKLGGQCGGVGDVGGAANRVRVRLGLRRGQQHLEVIVDAPAAPPSPLLPARARR